MRVRELDMEKLGLEAGAQGKQGVDEFLDGFRDGGRGGQRVLGSGLTWMPIRLINTGEDQPNHC